MWHYAKGMESLSPFWKHITAPHTICILMDEYVSKANKELTKLKLRYMFRSAQDNFIKLVDRILDEP